MAKIKKKSERNNSVYCFFCDGNNNMFYTLDEFYNLIA